MTQWKPKQLEWERREGLHDCFKAATGLSDDYFITSTSDGKFKPSFGLTSLSFKSELDDAKAACQADFERRWQGMSEPQPFWKPIDQCPKEIDVFYNLIIANEFYTGTWDGKSWIDSQFRPIRIQHIATHYAEIPPLEAGE